MEEFIKEKTTIKLNIPDKKRYKFVFIGPNTYMNYLSYFFKNELSIDHICIYEQPFKRAYTVEDGSVEYFEDLPIYDYDLKIKDHIFKYVKCENKLISYNWVGTEWEVIYFNENNEKQSVYVDKIFLCNSEPLRFEDVIMLNDKECYIVDYTSIKELNKPSEEGIYYLKNHRMSQIFNQTIYRIHPFYLDYNPKIDIIAQLILLVASHLSQKD
jgi:hypothetical protein